MKSLDGLGMKTDRTFILEHAGWPAFVVDGNGIVRHANAAAIALFGPKLEGDSTSLSALLAEGSAPAEKFLAAYDRHASPTVTLRFSSKGGHDLQSNVSLCPVRQDEKRYLFQILPDRPSTSAPTTESIDGGTQFFSKSNGSPPRPRLDRAAQLTRTVALDFNNALTSILGHNSLLLSKTASDHPWRKSLEEIQRASVKAAEIAHQLAAFSRPDKEAAPTFGNNLNEVLRRTVERFERRSGLHRRWRVELARPLYKTRFDEPKIVQVLTRLLDNAVEATSDQDEISVTSRNLDIAQVTHDGPVSLKPGTYTSLEIRDTGAGIDARHLPRIFEPFFTTKEGHRGLGLVLVYGIISNHGGAVTISSEPGRSTSVRLYLPAFREMLLDAPTGDGAAPGAQTILVVDDEELLRTMGRDILSSYGYQVLTAANGVAALEMLSRASPPVDLVIIDLVMPQMSGRELLTQIQLQHPGLPVICTSGYAGSGDGIDEGDFLEKPFTAQDLVTHVRRALQTAKKS